MALKTLGTNGVGTLNAFVFGNAMTKAEEAQFRANVLNDLRNTHPIWPGALEYGKLYVPNRGVLQLMAGDYVAYDAFGWPILVAKNAIASGTTSWTHS